MNDARTALTLSREALKQSREASEKADRAQQEADDAKQAGRSIYRTLADMRQEMARMAAAVESLSERLGEFVSRADIPVVRDRIASVPELIEETARKTADEIAAKKSTTTSDRVRAVIRNERNERTIKRSEKIMGLVLGAILSASAGALIRDCTAHGATVTHPVKGSP